MIRPASLPVDPTAAEFSAYVSLIVGATALDTPERRLANDLAEWALNRERGVRWREELLRRLAEAHAAGDTETLDKLLADWMPEPCVAVGPTHDEDPPRRGRA